MIEDLIGSASLFVDFENVFLSVQKNFSERVSPALLAQRLLELCQPLGDLRIRLAWADWDHFPGAQRAFALARFETRFVPTTTHGKNASDMAMQAEILTQAARAEAPERFVLATGDSDFVYAVEALKRAGHQVILISVPQAVSSTLRVAALRFIPLEPQRTLLAGEVPGASPDALLVRQCLEHAHIQRGMPWVSFRLLLQLLMDRGLSSESSAIAAVEAAVREAVIRRDEEHRGDRRMVRFSVPNPIQPHPSTPSSPTSGNEGLSARAPVYQAVEAFWSSHRSVSSIAPGGLSRETGSWESAGGARGAGGRGNQPGWDWQTQALMRILWHLEAQERGSSEGSLPRAHFLQRLSAVPGVGSEEARYWLGRGIERGFFEGSPSTLSADSGVLEQRIRIPKEQSWLMQVLELPICVAEALEAGLSHHKDWQGVAFSYLIRLLRLHPLLSAPEQEIPSLRLKDLLNMCLNDKLLYRYETPDLNAPEFTTTMIQWNPHHPLSEWVRSRCRSDAFFSPLTQARIRALLTLDHFLAWLDVRSPGEAWMPLVTLKAWLRDLLGDQLAREAVQDCEQNRTFLIDRFPHRDASGALVAGVVLQRTHPEVALLLQQRDRFLLLLRSLLHRRTSAPLPALTGMLEADGLLGPTSTHRLGWLALLSDTRVILLEREGPGMAGTRSSWSVRLNTRERFVQALIRRLE